MRAGSSLNRSLPQTAVSAQVVPGEEGELNWMHVCCTAVVPVSDPHYIRVPVCILESHPLRVRVSPTGNSDTL